MNWNYIHDVDADWWDQILSQSIDYNIFQSFNWGELKKTSGWKPLRLIGKDKSGQIVSIVQLLEKKLPFGCGFLWAPGGPILKFKNSVTKDYGNYLNSLIQILIQDNRNSLIRFQIQEKISPESSYQISKILKKPISRLTSGFTIHHDLSSYDDNPSRLMTAKHKYYYNRAIKNEIKWNFEFNELNFKSLIDLHNSMIISKKVKQPKLGMDLYFKLKNFFNDDNFTLLIGYQNETPITSCLTYNFGRKSIYMIAATNKLGREINIAYAMIPKLLLNLKKANIEHLDFGGIDPYNSSAEGVDHFKRGFGGKIIENIGEWEYARTSTLRILYNIGLSHLN